MTDLELLELAGKAVGMDGVYDADFDRVVLFDSEITPTMWNPLTDDGDALRLAVALQAAKGISWVICLSIGDNRTACEFHYACGPDPAANVRRAIVIAAAEHGKTLP